MSQKNANKETEIIFAKNVLKKKRESFGIIPKLFHLWDNLNWLFSQHEPRKLEKQTNCFLKKTVFRNFLHQFFGSQNVSANSNMVDYWNVAKVNCTDGYLIKGHQRFQTQWADYQISIFFCNKTMLAKNFQPFLGNFLSLPYTQVYAKIVPIFLPGLEILA